MRAAYHDPDPLSAQASLEALARDLNKRRQRLVRKAGPAEHLPSAQATSAPAHPVGGLARRKVTSSAPWDRRRALAVAAASRRRKPPRVGVHGRVPVAVGSGCMRARSKIVL